LFFFQNSSLLAGSIKLYSGWGLSGLNVTDSLQEGGYSPPVWFATCSTVVGKISGLRIADPSVTIPAVRTADCTNIPRIDVNNVDGVDGVLTGLQNSTGFNADINPMWTGQSGIEYGWLLGQTDAARKNFPPVATRFINKVQSPAAWTFSAASKTGGVTAPDGTTGAYEITSATTGYVNFYLNYGETITAGDYIIAGAWVQSVSPPGYSGNGFSPCIISITGATWTDYPGYGGPMPWGGTPNGANGEWSWCSNFVKVTSISTSPAVLQFWANVSLAKPINVYAPVLIHIAAGGITDNDAIEMAMHLQSYRNDATAGQVSLLPGQEFKADTATFSTLASTVAIGTPPLSVVSTTPVTNLSIGGNAATATLASTATLAATATALAAVPTQCTGVNFAQGIAANGDANCATPAGGGGTAPALKTNTVDNTSQLILDFTTSTANSVGLTITPSNPSGGVEKLEITGSSYTGNAATATALAANPTDCSANQFANAIVANGNLTCAAAVTANAGTTHQFLTSLTAGGVFSGARPSAADLSDSAVSGNYLRGNGTSFISDTIHAGDVPTLNQSTSGNAGTATALAANPTDCGTDVFAYQIDAGGNLTCKAALTANAGASHEFLTSVTAPGVFSRARPSAADLSDTATIGSYLRGNGTSFITGAIQATDVPTLNQSTNGNAATATALASVPTQCTGSDFAQGIAANGNANCATPAGGGGSAPTLKTNTVNNTSQLILDFTTSTANTLGLTITPSNPSGGIEKFEITGAYTGNAATATALAANPTDCSANQFSNAIAANGNLTCAAAVTANAGASHNFLTSLTAGGVFSYARPSAADLSDTATAGNYLRGNGTSFVSASINAGDVPTLNQSTSGNAASATALAAVPAQCGTNVPATGIAANGNANCTATPVLGAATATSLLATGIVDGLEPITITTGASASLGGTYRSGYTFNRNATAAAAITYTLPTAAAGRQYCVGNSDAAGVADTGTLRVNTSAAGQYIHKDGVRSASGGYIISAGAAGDKGCFVGTNTTDWEFFAQTGTWTIH
jgi:hypothetical protein